MEPNNKLEAKKNLEKKYKPWVIILSIIIPVVVVLLFFIKIEGVDFTFLPPVYATINGLVAVFLIIAVISIKNGNQKRHEFFIKLSIIGSLLFLVGYVAYHMTTTTTYYGDINKDGKLSDEERNALGKDALVYYFILASHIMLSIVIIPMVMMTYLKGWSGNYISHKKIARYTFPLWLYICITGVVVYLMISPYYS